MWRETPLRQPLWLNSTAAILALQSTGGGARLSFNKSKLATASREGKEEQRPVESILPSLPLTAGD